MATPEAETFEALQDLEQGKMQRLGDQLLPRVFPELATLRPHGTSDEGKTRTGVPDSFVGSSAKRCIAAVEYTTQNTGLLAKFDSDYSDVRARCLEAARIVLCTNRDCSKLDLDTLLDRAASDGVELSVIDGRTLASVLCRDSQDLREEFLQIPVTFFTIRSLLPAIRNRLDRLLNDLGREDEFVPRPQLDRMLMDRGVTRKPGVSVVVGALGQGKTVWSARWARSLANGHPVAWIPAGHVNWGGSAAIANAILHSIFGHVGESVHVLLAQLARTSLTCVVVVIDGIDEVADTALVRRSLDAFRRTDLLGESCHVVLTCRTGYDEHFFSLGTRSASRDPLSGRRIHVPDLTRAEREAFLQRMGCSPHQEREVRRRLPESRQGNPLLLRLGVQLLSSGGGAPEPDEWEIEFARRLHEDVAQVVHRRGVEHTDTALERCFAELGLLVLSEGPAVDELLLAGIPLCSEIGERLPPVVSAAIAAGVLERREGRMSFRHAFLCEYWAAKGVLLRSRGTDALQVIEGLPRRTAIARYASILSEEFRRAIAATDDSLILAVALPLPASREQIVGLEAQAVTALSSPYRTTVGRALTVLGRIATESSKASVANWTTATHGTAARFARDLADFCLSVESIEHASIVLCHDAVSLAASFGWYEPGFARRLTTISSEFRNALADTAHRQIRSPSCDSSRWRIGVAVLAYLGDERLVDMLSSVAGDRRLTGGEHAALLILNTDAAIRLYKSSCQQYFSELERIDATDDDTDTQRSSLIHELVAFGSNVHMFPHDALTKAVEQLLLDSNRFANEIGEKWALQLRHPQLLRAYAVRAGESWGSLTHRFAETVVATLSCEEALRLYESLPRSRTKSALLLELAASGAAAVERAILSALNVQEERYAAVAAVGRHGSQEGARRLLATFGDLNLREKGHVARAFGRLRYMPALEILIEELQAVQERESGDDDVPAQNLEYDIVVALGNLGGEAVWETLVKTFRRGRLATVCLVLLLRANEPKTLAIAKALVNETPEAATTRIVEALAHRHLHAGATSFGPHEVREPEYDDAELFAFVQVEAQRLVDLATSGDAWSRLASHHVVDCVASFDLDDARTCLRELASHRESGLTQLRDAAWQATKILASRGDLDCQEALVESTLSRIGERDELYVSGHEVDELRTHPGSLLQPRIADRLRTRAKPLAAWVWLAVQLGLECDKELIVPLLHHEDETVADFANEYLVGARSKQVR